MTHSDLVDIAHKWLTSRCGFVLKEFVANTGNGETPDVIGFNSDGTFIIEVKTSIQDFKRDGKKMFRQHPFMGLGDWRFYCCEAGLIKESDLPLLWGLIEIDKKGKAKITYNPFGKGNIYSNWKRHEKYEKGERAIMYSVLRRLGNNEPIDKYYKPI